MACVYASPAADSAHAGNTSSSHQFVAGIGMVKVLRGKVEYKVQDGKLVYKA